MWQFYFVFYEFLKWLLRILMYLLFGKKIAVSCLYGPCV